MVNEEHLNRALLLCPAIEMRFKLNISLLLNFDQKVNGGLFSQISLVDNNLFSIPRNVL